MENQNGLADRARFDAFSRQWRDAVLKEAGKWCSDENAKQLLTDAVLTDLRTRYAYRDPPASPEYFFRAQVCLVFSMTGQDVRKLEKYLSDHAFASPAAAPEAPAAAPTEDASSPASGAAATPENAAPPEAGTAAPTENAAPPEAGTAAPKDAPADKAPVPDKAAPDKAAPAPEAQAPARPDTFLDPVRTTFWTPVSEGHGHKVAEIVLPDEEESERSVMISFLNTVLFLLTAGAFAFCFYETGFLQYLLQ